MEILKNLQLAVKSFQLQQNPGKTDLIFDIVDIASSLKRNQKMIEKMEVELLRNNGFKQMWEEKWNAPVFTLESLAEFPIGTLGHAYLTHLQSNDLKPNFYRMPEVKRLINYLSYRLYSVHDIWHALLGYDSSVIGELEIQGFTVAQLKTPISIYLISGGLYKLLRFNPTESINAFERVNQAFNLGKKASFLLDVRVEGLLGENLETLRDKLQLTRLNSNVSTNHEYIEKRQR
jgi:ubiquinone biosynthesis protein COQ4